MRSDKISVKCAHFPARQRTFHTRVCGRTRAILAQMHLFRASFRLLDQIFGSISTALFLVSFLLLGVRAPYLRLILAQTSMKPMQMIRERERWAAASGKKKHRRQSTFEMAREPPMHRELHFCASFPPLSSRKVGLMQKMFFGQCLPSRKVSHLLFRRRGARKNGNSTLMVIESACSAPLDMAQQINIYSAPLPLCNCTNVTRPPNLQPRPFCLYVYWAITHIQTRT